MPFDPNQFASPASARFPTVESGKIHLYRGTFPVLVSDGGGGSLIYIREKGYLTRCCGEPTGDSVQSFVWSGTRNPKLTKLGMGATVHNLYSACDHCGAVEAS